MTTVLKVGLTGGIGCGKSTAVNRFIWHGVPVIDADQIAREVVLPDQPALQALVNLFGQAVLTESGELDRAWLRAKVFADAAARAQLEAVLHPALHQRILERMDQVGQTRADYVLVDVPLLFEKNYKALFDRIVVVDCLPEQQFVRVKARDGSDDKQIAGIIAAQASRSERLGIATDRLDNTLTQDWLETQVDRLHEKFKEITATSRSPV